MVDIIRYGPHPSQFAELSQPPGRGPFPLVVVVHGGFWRTGYGLELGRPLAADLRAHGLATLNVEYRRGGSARVAGGGGQGGAAGEGVAARRAAAADGAVAAGGGGWPATCADVAAAVDALADYDVDLGRVVALGHSAGGHLAGWLASRGTLPSGCPGANPVVAVCGFVSQAGVLDLGWGAQKDWDQEPLPTSWAAARRN